MGKLGDSLSAHGPLPKVCGTDTELGNFVLGLDQPGGTGRVASRALLAEISGLPRREHGYYSYTYGAASGYGARSGSESVYGYWPSAGTTALEVGADNRQRASTSPGTYDPMDVGRRYLTNGGCAYIDLDHAELCIPEVRSAFDHVAAWHAMLRILGRAQEAANATQPEGRCIQVLVNNSDGLGNSYGSHLSFLIRRRTWDNIFCRKAHYLQFLASFQISSLPLTGQGKVGSENGRPAVRFQLSQRADYFATLTGAQTTFDRPLVNSRDESLCGFQGYDNPLAAARLHVIFFDNALAHGSALFRVGTMQLVLTLIELGLVNPRLILDDPLEAVLAYSHDPTLAARAELLGGERFTALELQNAYLEEVKRHAARGVFEGVVPRFEEIIALWEDTLGRLEKRDWTGVAPRLDWVMKLMAIERSMAQHPGLSWDSPEVKMVDHLYSRLGDGLYWAYEASGFAAQLVTPERIAHFTANPPEDTRAWTRAMLLRRADPEDVSMVNWDAMTFRMGGGRYWPSYRTLEMPDPSGGTRAGTEEIFDTTKDFEELLTALEAHFPRPAQTVRAYFAN